MDFTEVVAYLKQTLQPDLESELSKCVGWIATLAQMSIESHRIRHEATVTRDISKHEFGIRLEADGSKKVTDAYLNRAYMTDPASLAAVKALHTAREHEDGCGYLRDALRQKMQAVLAAINLKRDEAKLVS